MIEGEPFGWSLLAEKEFLLKGLTQEQEEKLLRDTHPFVLDILKQASQYDLITAARAVDLAGRILASRYDRQG